MGNASYSLIFPGTENVAVLFKKSFCCMFLQFHSMHQMWGHWVNGEWNFFFGICCKTNGAYETL